MMSPLRWGICTAGLISTDFVSSLQGHSDNHQVVAIATRTLERSQKFATKFKIPTAYGSYEELAQDENVDVVYIGAVNTEHVRLSKLYLNHRKNVLCEKPLALTLRDARDVLKTAKENDVFFMEAVWSRFFPVSAKIRELISSGQLGDVKSIFVNFGLDLNHVERLKKKELGGGALYDMGIYPIQLTTMVFGRAPSSMTTQGFLNDDGVDESFTTVMKFSNNALATLSSSFKVKYPNDAVIIGTKGRLRIPEHVWAPTDLIWTSPNGEVIERFHFPLPKPTESGIAFDDLPSGLLYEADAVKQAIQEGKKEHALMGWKESELIATVMEKARRDLGVVWIHEGQSPIVILA
nr:trans-1,2-dihydrobenzene-1,2-diol dehydrogenase-like [Lytechinus pictus]